MPRPRTRKYRLTRGPGADLAHALARNVLAARARAEMPQSRLAQEADIGLRTMQRIELAEAVADLNSLAKLAAALGVKPSDLLL